ncbi:lipopolysaccharide biosynthesis protein [Microbacterium sufflavum]|uniref:Lipopolysaccharide biosynthesis protein n=1 Tax=Microbacterium sufflavum TaxID=2851649 RepID=A0ABY4IET8_9MICO|nr:lipopolysaccharide biosynthesis protein [Microbacterium sufflavum]UPL11295.1 lipopolysaccharide biosynthesis protein [Microbacterium sufflavum]
MWTVAATEPSSNPPSDDEAGGAVRSRVSYLGRADHDLGTKSALAIVTKVSPGLATLTTNLLVGRLGGAHLLGLTQTAISTAALTSLAYPGPAASAASRFVAASVAAGDPEKARVVASYLARRVVFAIVCLIGLVIGSSFLAGVDNTTVVVVSSVMTAGLSARIFVEGLHFGGGEGRRLAVGSLAVAAAGTAGSAILLLLGNRTPWVIVPVAVANVIFAVVTWPPRASGVLKRGERRAIRHFMIIAAFGTLASSGFVQLTTIVANASGGASFAGEYAAALTLTTPLAILATAISATLFPALSAMHAGSTADVVRHRVTEASSILTWLIATAVCTMIILAVPLVEFVWGSPYSNTWWILQFLLIGTLATTVAVPSVTALTSSSNKGMLISAGTSFFGALIGAITWLVLIPTAGERGVMIGCVVATVLTGLLPYVIVWRHYRMRWARSTIEVVGIVALSIGLGVLAREGLWNGFLAPVLALAVIVAWTVIRYRDVRRAWTVIGPRLKRKKT